MEAISLQTREVLRQEMLVCGQTAVIQKIPQFQIPEVRQLVTAPAEVKSCLKAVAFNMERGVNLAETLEFLTCCPDLSDMDIILGNELDDGNVRSGQKNVALEIAEYLGMNYVFGVEFIELADPNNEKGFHGNAIFSRWPILRAETFYPCEEYNWYHSEQPRIGARVAILAELGLAGTKVGVVTAHLENRTDPAGRRRQMREILDRIQVFFPEDEPVFLGGDFNTFTYTDDEDGFGEFLRSRQAGEQAPDVLAGELLLRDIEEAGFHLSDCNRVEISTCRDFYERYQQPIEARVDWLAARQLTPMENGTVSTLIADCGWAPADGALRRFPGKEVSDHNAVWLTTAWPASSEVTEV